ncbi:class I mannose-6-phosphate isomerase [Streptosporangium sp. CA-135522]|uniref:class I mannose-6-phosphate isomerase n=1 Tax=Streptosporangium sp. CA-135522 TaxID=3240072 RepID=UPI003D8D3E3F
MPELRPIPLTANQPRHFYRGGGNIGRFRGAAPPDDYRPEDWVGSATCRFGADALGLTVLPDGRTLPAAIATDPAGWLGPAHLDRWGDTPALLVKLLDAGQRLPVHCHPSRDFAGAHLGSAFGKTEAWLVVDVPEGGEGQVYLGFQEEVAERRLREWSRVQDRMAILEATNPVTVRPGDAVLVPAGLPHAVDAGVFLVEIQEPTDFSVLIEWAGFAPYGGTEGHLRLGWDTALRCVDRRAWSKEEIAGLVRRPSALAESAPGVRRVLPESADPYFRAELVGAGAELAESFAVLVVLGGIGELEPSEGEPLPLKAGETLLVPYGSGPATVHGEVEVLRCLPPSPGTPPGGGV